MVQYDSASRDRQSRFRLRNRLGLISLGCAGGIVLSVVAFTVLTWPQAEVVFRDHDSSTKTYSDESRHYLGLVHEQTMSGRESYRLMVGRDPGLSYGHSVEVDSYAGADGIKSADWSAAGVRVRFNTGHELFVPAKHFEHGR